MRYAFGPLSRAFLDHLRERNLAPNTIRGHRANLKALLGYLVGIDIADIRAVTRETVWMYAEQVMGRHLSQHTKALRLITVRAFFAFLMDRDLILVDPAASLPRLKEPVRLPREPLTREEANLILAQPRLRTPAGYRDRAMLETLYSTGLRASELVNLAVGEVDLTGGFVRVNRGKGRKDRVVPLGRVARRFLAEYLRSVRPLLAKGASDGHLFVVGPGRAVSYNTLATRLRGYVRAAGIEKRATAHVFRHTCATEMLRGGSSIRHVQEMLGHADISSTQVYTRVLPLDLLGVHRRCHPSDRRRSPVPEPPPEGAPLHHRERRGCGKRAGG